MLQILELSNFAIVDSLQLELSPGLNVLTGETGAGKSILIDALALLIGNRAESSWIRGGSGSALIQGIFAPHTGIESASRRLVSTGRSTARLNGELVTITELSERLRELIVIHGQHSSQTLLGSSEQRRLLDRLLDKKTQAKLNSYRSSFVEYQQVSKELESLREQLRERARRIDILQFQFDEIGKAKLKPNELERLEEELESLRFAERIMTSSTQAHNGLSEDEVNAVALIAEAVKQLEQAGRYHKALASLAGELSDALASIEAISNELGNFISEFEADPARLELLETRLAQIDDLKRKYGESIPAILAYQDQTQQELDKLLNADASMSSLESRQQMLLKNLSELAKDLSEARTRTAKHLSQAVSKEICILGMPNAIFEVSLTASSKLGPFGFDEVSFLFSANLGESLAPLSNVASGGELSRVMLGLNVVTGSDVPILAFDEVDTGIGGKTARTIGSLLKRLAKEHQVLVVTHLPQVAAFADTQFYVEKLEQGKRTVTRVSKLEPHERELELARMLSGSVTDAAIANARELLKEVQGHR